MRMFRSKRTEAASRGAAGSGIRPKTYWPDTFCGLTFRKRSTNDLALVQQEQAHGICPVTRNLFDVEWISDCRSPYIGSSRGCLSRPAVCSRSLRRLRVHIPSTFPIRRDDSSIYRARFRGSAVAVTREWRPQSRRHREAVAAKCQRRRAASSARRKLPL
jgi:hypothetical protein